MVKAVLALVLGILLMVTSAAAYAYVRLTRSDDTPTTTTTDPGAAACESVLALHNSGAGIDAVDAATIAGLTGSGDANLQAAGEEFERFAALPDDQPATETEVLAALTQLATGCAAVGVSLPSELVSPPPSPS